MLFRWSIPRTQKEVCNSTAAEPHVLLSRDNFILSLDALLVSLRISEDEYTTSLIAQSIGVSRVN